MEPKKGYLLLVISFVLLYLLIVYIAPLGKKLPMVQPLVQTIEENNINAGAIYYTDIEIFSEAEINMQNTMKFFSIREAGIKKEAQVTSKTN